MNLARRSLSVLIALIAAAAIALPAYASGPLRTLAVNGEVKMRTTYTVEQLAALPQSSFTVRGHTFSGVLLETLVTTAQPDFPPKLLNTKNELLRVTATVRGTGLGKVTFAVGELDSNFGNHPALVAISRDNRQLDAPAIVVPGDTLPLRDLTRASEVTVGIATAEATNTTPAPGSPLTVIDGRRTRTLSAQLLAHLPRETRTVSFGGPNGIQTHTEVGPPLLEVLLVADVLPNLNTWVAATGSDNYVATVTPGEQFVGGRHLQLSLIEDGVTLAQPRLVVDGDVKGGRYVSGVVDLYVGSGPAD